LNPKAQRKQQHQKKPTWKVHAYFLDACNCDWGCPCQFSAKPTHDNCEGVAGYHIVTGSYGTNVKLDGLNMALIASWPGPIHEGRGTLSFYIDNRANENQFEALSNIITGRAGGGPFEIYASTIEKLYGPKRANIKFQAKDLRSRVSVLNIRGDRKRQVQKEQSPNVIAEAWLEPIRNPVTGKVHRAIIEIPEAFESSRMEQASTKTLLANNNNLNFRYEGTYGSFSKNTWKGP
jgi:hypothetical protein